nr:retrovirus-related Pol polyprotein from transposon 17.6 [Tanacetum cinerariifolium]
MATLTDMVSKLVSANAASSSGSSTLPADFVVVDFEHDPRVPLILGRCFLKTSRALIDVHKGELTLRIRNEAITYKLDQTVRYSANYNQMTTNKINVVEEYSQEVLGFSNVTDSGISTRQNDPIVFITSPTLTPFGDGVFLLFEEAGPFLGLEDDPDSPKINPFYYDPEGDILLLEAILNKVKLKDLPHHLEYAFLEGNNKLPVIIAKELGRYQLGILYTQNSNGRGLQTGGATSKMGKSQNPRCHKKEVEKLLDAGLIYPISDSPWVSPVHCVPKKGGFTVVENEENELIPTRLVTGWRVCIDYRKLNEATRKDYFPLPFMDQMLERLAGNEYYCFLDGFSRCMLAIFHDMVEKTMEVFMDDFSVFGNSFKNCLSLLDKMLQWCKDTNLSLNWEKGHFMVKEGIVLGHKISKNEIEVDRAKVDDAKARLLRWVLLLQEFDFDVLDTKGAENLAADHLSRLENPYENVLDPKEITKKFPLETLSMVTFRRDFSAPWFADFENYYAGNFIVKVIQRCVHGKEAFDILESCHNGPTGGHHGANLTAKRSLMPVFFSPPFTKMPTSLLKIMTRANGKGKFHNGMRCLRIPSKLVKSLTYGASILWARSRLHEGTNIFLWQSTIYQNGLKRKRSPPTTPVLFANSSNLSSSDLVHLELS